jgi:hypothetical protein
VRVSDVFAEFRGLDPEASGELAVVEPEKFGALTHPFTESLHPRLIPRRGSCRHVVFILINMEKNA